MPPEARSAAAASASGRSCGSCALSGLTSSGSGSKAPVSAFPQCKPIGAAERDKAQKEIRTKFRKHCSSFLLGKCTRDKCSYTHAVPSGFKAAARTLGYKQLGAAAKGVSFE